MDLLKQMDDILSCLPQWQVSQKVVVAVSGGVDSMVLLTCILLLNQRLPQEQKKKIILAHFDHDLRTESYLDWQLIKDYISDKDLIYFQASWSLPVTKNIEAQARQARYQFFADVMEMTESSLLLTGHHLNDLGETVLMRLLRGTSMKGLSGFQLSHQRLLQTSRRNTIIAQIVRPFIYIDKESLYQYAVQNQIPFLEDESNYEDEFLRNRIRHQILPMFEAENPQFLRNLTYLTDQLQSSYQAHFENYLQVEPEFLTPYHKDSWLLYIPRLLELSDEERQIYLLIFFEERLVYQLPHYNKIILTQMEHLISQDLEPNMVIDIAQGWVAQRSYDYIYIYQGSSDLSHRNEETVIVKQLNTWYTLSKHEFIGVFEQGYIQQHGYVMVGSQVLRTVDFNRGPLRIRHRKDGDTLHLQRKDGRDYHKKVARIMIDHKIPRFLRQDYWVVEQNGELLELFPKIDHDPFYVAHQASLTSKILYKKVHNAENLC